MILFILLVFAIISGYFGCFIIWNRITNYFDTFAHSAIFSITIAHILHLNEFLTLLLFSVIFSSLLCVCILLKITLNNNLLIVLGSFFVGSAGIINGLCNKHEHGHGCQHHHDEGMVQLFLGHNLSTLSYQNLLPYLYISIGLFAIALPFTKKWIKNIINDQLVARTKLYHIYYFSFLILIGIFSIITVEINGILLAIATTIFPALISRFFAKTPYQMIIYSIIFSAFVTTFSFFVCNKLNINYNGFLIVLEFIIFISLSIRSSIYAK